MQAGPDARLAQKRRKVRLDVPWKDLKQWERDWLLYGDGDDPDEMYEQGLWYGIAGFFKYLEKPHA